MNAVGTAVAMTGGALILLAVAVGYVQILADVLSLIARAVGA